MKERATFTKDIYSEGIYLFESPEQYDETVLSKKWKTETEEQVTSWKEKLEQLNTFDPNEIEIAFKSFLEEQQIGIGAFLPIFRILLTGIGMGPSMFEIAAFLGKEETLNRMNQGLIKVKEITKQA
jgi:glutamyl-tRNA synthetase